MYEQYIKKTGSSKLIYFYNIEVKKICEKKNKYIF